MQIKYCFHYAKLLCVCVTAIIFRVFKLRPSPPQPPPAGEHQGVIRLDGIHLLLTISWVRSTSHSFLDIEAL